MPSGSSRVLVPGMLNLIHTSNPGVAFGLFADSDMPWRAPLLIVFSVGCDRADRLAAGDGTRGRLAWAQAG